MWDLVTRDLLGALGPILLSGRTPHPQPLPNLEVLSLIEGG
jgi:hypothetical protein